jgi:5-methylcytosine-specific restriction endonuclease McrA
VGVEIIGEHNLAIDERRYYQRVKSPKSNGGRTYTQEEIEEIRIGQKNRCRYFRFCGTAFDTVGFQIDHRVPVTRGGRNTKDNLQLLCVSCNTSKKSSGHDAFVRKLKALSGRSNSVGD